MPFKLGLTVEEVLYPAAETYADLPAAGEHEGDIYVVLTATGTWGVDRKRAGLWRSDGVNWNVLGAAPTAEQLGAISSLPPSGMKAVKNMYYDQNLGRYTIEREE